jgi:predicted dehydrogenase
MRRNGALAADYAQRHGVPRWYDNADALINDPEVDAVYVATPPGSHREVVQAVARAGKPVYVEKPMALDHAECLAMIDACQRAGVPLFVAYYRRALPRFRKIKELIEAGAIGQPRAASISLSRTPPEDLDPADLPWRYLPEIAGGGLLADLACHILDFLDYALGPIQQVEGHASNQAGQYPAEDIVSGSFVFENGTHGVGMWCFTSFERTDRVEIVGSEGKLVFPCFELEPITLTTGQGVTAFDIPNPPHIQQPLIQTIVNSLNGVGQCPSTGVTGARTNWVMDQLLASYRRG